MSLHPPSLMAYTEGTAARHRCRAHWPEGDAYGWSPAAYRPKRRANDDRAEAFAGDPLSGHRSELRSCPKKATIETGKVRLAAGGMRCEERTQSSIYVASSP